MNNVIRAVVQESPEHVRPFIKLPAYVRLGFLVFVIIAVIVAGWLLHLRLYSQPYEAFAANDAALPGQIWKAEVSSKYSCRLENNLPNERKYCTYAPIDGPFSLIDVTVWDGVVKRANFTITEGRLAVGDLASLWGEPIVHLYGPFANFEWPGAGVKARGWAANGKFSYFIPVHHISLGSQPDE